MKILGIETSCDETAVSIIEATGDIMSPSFKILGDALYSQAKTHAKFGGVFPSLAKREHAKNLAPLLEKVLTDSGMNKNGKTEFDERKLKHILEREPGLFETLSQILNKFERPDIDAIAVTAGPGLEPALWVGINFARALGIAWNIPVLPSNHMEGHIASVLLSSQNKVNFPALALLISGGHTELVLIKNWLDYEVIGKTKDDAVGEAFDKVARILSLPYPGGPHISKLAEQARSESIIPKIKFPRPMLKTPDFDFSFSGLKTSVLYSAKKLEEISDQDKKEFALEFENAVTEVLVEKTRKALEEYSAKTLIIGGGVVANKFIRKSFEELVSKYSDTGLFLPELSHSTDNSLMIAVAGYLNWLSGKRGETIFEAKGNLSL